jgi:hypothetical protein
MLEVGGVWKWGRGVWKGGVWKGRFRRRWRVFGKG